MSDSLLLQLKDRFGFNEFRDHQESIVQSILAGQDTVAVLPTGSGKSLCYQLPATLKQGTAIVISPLIALMEDQVQHLTKSGISSLCLTSHSSSADRDFAFQRLTDLTLLYVSPERLTDPSFLDWLKGQSISIFVIDEAHCISQWGHAFRPQYRELRLLKHTFPDIPIAAFTATATPAVIQDIISQLQLQQPTTIIGSFDRPNLMLSIQQRLSGKSQLRDFLDTIGSDSGIIYAGTRKKVDQTCEYLATQGISVGKYHAGLTQSERADAQKDFIHDRVQIMVATVAFGMGINKPDVRFVCHLDMPKNMEQYYQEIGRAGRDGLPATCIMWYSLQDVVLQKKLIDDVSDSTILHAQLRKIDQMAAYAQSANCRRHELLRYFNDELPHSDPCNNCDNCLDKSELIDGTEIAQKILSCVYRLKQRFGITTVVDVLVGAKTQAIKSRGHDQLSTYGLLSDHPKTHIKTFVYALINMGALMITDDEYPVVRLTQASRPILFDGQTVQFKPPVQTKKSTTSKKSTSTTTHTNNTVLLDALKTCRNELARKEGVPPYMIFSNKTLIDMANSMPQSMPDFLMVNGVGPHKARRYGDTFLSVIQATNH